QPIPHLNIPKEGWLLGAHPGDAAPGGFKHRLIGIARSRSDVSPATRPILNGYPVGGVAELERHDGAFRTLVPATAGQQSGAGDEPTCGGTHWPSGVYHDGLLHIGCLSHADSLC